MLYHHFVLVVISSLNAAHIFILLLGYLLGELDLPQVSLHVKLVLKGQDIGIHQGN
jgi:hypothetical protein